MSKEEAIKILEDESQIIFDFTTGKADEKWKKAYNTVIQIAKNSIPKKKVEEKIEKLKEEREKQSEYDYGCGILQQNIICLQELLEGK